MGRKRTVELGVGGKGDDSRATTPKRYRGRVKWFEHDKGYGFILYEGGNAFMHKSNLSPLLLEKHLTKKNIDGLEVEFEIAHEDKGARAVEIRLLGEEPPSQLK